jgi:hypothetical protein
LAMDPTLDKQRVSAGDRKDILWATLFPG